MPAPIPYAERFADKWIPVPESGCWLWTGTPSKNFGYGELNVNGRSRPAHRVSWELHRGPIGDLCVLHKCDTPSCVNPDHLFLGTRTENMEDKCRKGRQKPGGLKGERVPGAKLNEAAVLAIRASGATHAALAREYAVDEALISRVRQRKAWAHV